MVLKGSVFKLLNHESTKKRKHEKERIHHPLAALARDTENTEKSF